MAVPAQLDPRSDLLVPFLRKLLIYLMVHATVICSKEVSLLRIWCAKPRDGTLLAIRTAAGPKSFTKPTRRTVPSSRAFRHYQITRDVRNLPNLDQHFLFNSARKLKNKGKLL